jgi:hypothetical protein
VKSPHTFAWIVIGPHGGALRDNGIGIFVEGSYGEVFTDQKAARWLFQKERNWFRHMAQWYRQGRMINGECIVTGSDLEHANYYERCAGNLRLIKIAMPGTYAQLRIPGRLERELRKAAEIKPQKIIAIERKERRTA